MTSVNIFYKYIFPYIKDILYEYIWVDLFAGEGNLILPILESIPFVNREQFFRERIFLFDIQQEMVNKAREKVKYYGISENATFRNISQQDTLKVFPKFILKQKYPVFHITNPPYLYIGYIVKNRNRNLIYFQAENKGYQDLYQVALMNDLRHGVTRMAYILPLNFLYGESISNKIRRDFLKFYNIDKSYLFEDRLFEYTGTHVGLFFFKRKQFPAIEPIRFEGVKIRNGEQKIRQYTLVPENNFRAGSEFDKFVKCFKAKKPLKVKFYLTANDVLQSPGNSIVSVIDANEFNGKSYEKKQIKVSEEFKREIISNILFARTIDTGTEKGKAGIYVIKDVFGVNGIFASTLYRTHPIQIFIYPTLKRKDQLYLKQYFNLLLGYFREVEDSEFLTTFKYSETEYTRKYLGLTKVKQLIQTFPILTLSKKERREFIRLITQAEPVNIINFVKRHNM